MRNESLTVADFCSSALCKMIEEASCGQSLKQCRQAVLSFAVTNEEAEHRSQIIRKFQRDADRICILILSSDCTDEQISIQRLALRTDVARYFPDQVDLYDLIYESRFRRLWQQFRDTT